MKRANVYIDGNYLIDKIDNNSKELDWNGFKLSLFKKVAQELHLDPGELLLENAFLFLTKNEKEKLKKDILGSINSSYITIILDKYSESTDSIETAITWQICKNYYKNPYDICILITDKDYSTVLEKLKTFNISTFIDNSTEGYFIKEEPKNALDIRLLEKEKKQKPFCPYCNQNIDIHDYIPHLSSHIEYSQQKLYSKTLQEDIKCCFCDAMFKATESNIFLTHLFNQHYSESAITIKDRNGLKRCARCNSILSGCHPMVIIQHILQGCHNKKKKE